MLGFRAASTYRNDWSYNVYLEENYKQLSRMKMSKLFL